mgnify:CR=1 FL=1
MTANSLRLEYPCLGTQHRRILGEIPSRRIPTANFTLCLGAVGIIILNFWKRLGSSLWW